MFSGSWFLLLKCRSHEKYHPLFSGNMAGRMPDVILIGNVGAGKSTLVEKVSGETALSSAASTSVTKTAGKLKNSIS